MRCSSLISVFLDALAASPLIASGRDALLSRFAIHSSSSASWFGGSRTPTEAEPTRRTSSEWG
jgi:hypothetical protein